MYPAALIFSTWIWGFVNSRLFGGAPHSTQAASRAWGGIMRDLKTTSRGCVPTLRRREGQGTKHTFIADHANIPVGGAYPPIQEKCHRLSEDRICH